MERVLIANIHKKSIGGDGSHLWSTPEPFGKYGRVYYNQNKKRFEIHARDHHICMRIKAVVYDRENNWKAQCGAQFFQQSSRRLKSALAQSALAQSALGQSALGGVAKRASTSMEVRAANFPMTSPTSGLALGIDRRPHEGPL